MADPHSIAIWQTMTVQTAIRQASDAYGEFVAQRHEAFLQTMGPSSQVESPIEAVFWTWWQTLELTRGEFPFYLVPQHQVEYEGHNYRLDFAIPEARIAIELDGHDFHEKTKEQVTYRNTRDRHLQALGWVVLHFSGSEIYHQQVELVAGVVALAEQRIKNGA